MKNHKIQWLAALLACAMLSGCGDDGETTESTGIDTGSGGSGGGVGGGANNNGGRLQFSVSSLTVAEDGGNATVTVTRTDGSDGAVSVTVTSSDGSAAQPSDYTAVSTTVSFAAGDTAAKTVNVPIINDTAAETAETLHLALSSATGGAALGSTSEVLITITDNDVAAPAMSRAVISSGGPGRLRIDWTASTGATSYRVMKDATGSAGFTQVGSDLPESARFAEVNVATHLEDWANGRYAVAACNSAGCTQSDPVSADGLSASAIGYIKPSHGVEQDRFGSMVALSADGNTLAVSAPGDDAAGSGVDADPTRGDCSVWPLPADCAWGAGAVYVFAKANGTWSSPVYIKAPATAMDDNFGSALSLSADGNTLAVGSSGRNNYQGAAYIYTRTGSGWELAASLAAADATDNASFGNSVALTPDGAMLAVGAPDREDGALINAGGVYVFTRSGDTWTQQPAVLTQPTPSQFSYFGDRVALAGTAAAPVLAIGVPGEDALSDDAVPVTIYDVGAVYVHTLQGAAWTSTRLEPATRDYYLSFGRSVALDAAGTLLAVGDETDVVDAASGAIFYSAGQVHVYRHASGSWTRETSLQSSNPQSSMAFGYSLSLSADGNTLAAGAVWESGSGSGVGSTPDQTAASSGAAYVFTRTATTWSAARYIKASNTHVDMGFGSAIALDGDGDTLAVGADSEDGSSTTINGNQLNDCGGAQTQCAADSGAVYLY